MARPITVLPDAPLAVIQYLRSHHEVTDLVPASRITTVIPPKPTYPLITVQRMGGKAIVNQRIDEPALQINVLGDKDDQETISHVARAVRAAIVAIQNDVVDAGTLVAGYEETGPQWIPDTTTVPPLGRFIGRYSVILHP